jgi:hypothetical protein
LDFSGRDCVDMHSCAFVLFFRKRKSPIIKVNCYSDRPILQF